MRSFSYHKTAILCAALASIAASYEDTRQRFTIELGPAWKLAPRFGDLYGTSFDRALEAGESATLTVHADPVEAPDLKTFADRVEAEWSRAAKTSRKKESKRIIAGHKSIERELAVDGTSRRARMFVLQANGRFYHLRFEAPAGAIRTLDKELDKILASFRPGAPKAVEDEEAAAEEFERALPIQGVWIGKNEIRFELREDGGFTLGKREGRYVLKGDVLELETPGKAALRFIAALSEDGRELRLSTPSLPEPAIYRRSAQKQPEGDAPLPGRWAADTPRGTIVLVLSPNGSFEMGPLHGRWSAQENRLKLLGGQGESVTYRFEIRGRTLRLSGGDLETALEFRRITGE